VGDCFDVAGNPTANFNPSFCNAQLTVKQGGNTNLKPEESRQTTLGLVFQPNRDWQFSLDLWRVKMDKQIGIPDADARLADFIQPFVADQSIAYDPSTAKLTAAGKAALLAGATGTGIVRDTVSGNLDFVSSQFDNIASTSITGVDISIGATLARTESGTFRGNVELAYIHSWKQDGTDFVGVYSQFGPVVRWKMNSSLDWTLGNWTTTFGQRWQSGYRDQGGTRDVESYELFDIAVAYRGVKNLTLRAGIQNLADNKPPYSRQGDYFHVGYDPTYGDPRGRTYTFNMNYQFK
jgi:iron complex outermembrane receptor protein